MTLCRNLLPINWFVATNVPDPSYYNNDWFAMKNIYDDKAPVNHAKISHM